MIEIRVLILVLWFERKERGRRVLNGERKREAMAASTKLRRREVVWCF